MKQTRNRIFTAAVIAAAFALGGQALLAGDCYTAEVAQPIALPDGSISDGGQVKVCRVKQLTPASTLHSLSIDGRNVGLFLGARQSVELDPDAAARPSMLFARNGVDALEFRAVAYAVDGRYQAFRAARIGRARHRVPARDAFETALAGDAGSVLVAVAAAD